MQDRAASIAPLPRFHQGDKQLRVLALSADRGERPSPSVECPRNVTLLVLPGGEDQRLLSPPQIGIADPAIKMAVGFVDVEDFRVGTSRRHHLRDLLQDLASPPHRDAQRRPGLAPPTALRPQQHPNIAYTQLHSGIALQLQSQQLQGPRGALPAQFPRRAVQIAEQSSEDFRSSLYRSALGPQVAQAGFAPCLKAGARAVDGGPDTTHHGGNDTDCPTFVQQQHYPTPHGFDAIVRFPQALLHPSSLPPGQVQVYGHEEEPSFRVTKICRDLSCNSGGSS